ncbi:MAG TPA: hypothetical protein DDY37_08085, partial [Legionella sp.]|nr:hypothetical protein [Legionella sp.]
MESIINNIGFGIFIYFSMLWVGYTFFLLGTYITIMRKHKASEFNNIMSKFNQRASLPITVIIPAFNEERRIKNAITAILNADYKNINVVVVNDASTDGTLQLLIDTYMLKKIPAAFKKKIKTSDVYAYYQSSIFNLIVVDKQHCPLASSAADSINAGLNVCRTPIFMTVDADTIVEPEAITRMLYMYLTHTHCIAIGGDIYIPDAFQMKDSELLEDDIPFNLVVGVQGCEYLRSFSYGREGGRFLGGALCHPGAFTMFETEAVIRVGGYDPQNFSYNAEIIIRLHHRMRNKQYPYSMIYSPSSIAWSEGPHTVRQLWHQRNQWQRGLLRCLFRYKEMVLNPKYGVAGLLAFPYYILFEALGPIVEAISYILLVFVLWFKTISLAHLAWLFFIAWGYMMLMTLSCVVLNLLTHSKRYKKRDILHLFVLTTVDMLFYRQVKAFCALTATIQYFIHRMR